MACCTAFTWVNHIECTDPVDISCDDPYIVEYRRSFSPSFFNPYPPTHEAECDAFCDYHASIEWPGNWAIARPGGTCYYRYCREDFYYENCFTDWSLPGEHNAYCSTLACCIECANGQYHCTQTRTPEDCEQGDWSGICQGLGSHVSDVYSLPRQEYCGGESNVCGKEIPCCLPGGGCAMRTYRQCVAAGGEPSANCYDSCTDSPPCCPPPVPCCHCGECQMLSQASCDRIGGTVHPFVADCNSATDDLCQVLDRRPCRYAVMLPTPSTRATAPAGYMDVISTAPLPKLEPDQTVDKHRVGHTWAVPWMCHESHKGRMVTEMGFAVQSAAGELGCMPDGAGGLVAIPEGYAALVAPYREACDSAEG